MGILNVTPDSFSDGGRYLDTFCGVVTEDKVTGRDNIGLYRGMVIDRDKIAKLLAPIQGWGGHLQAYMPEPMPVAVVYGWHDVMPFCAGSPFPKDVCEWDMMGAILGRPVELVACETVPLHVPASAEIVVETGKQFGVGRDYGQLAEREPLAGEILNEGDRLGILQHALNLSRQIAAQIAAEREVV